MPEVAVLASDLARIAHGRRLDGASFCMGSSLLPKILPPETRRALRSMVGRRTQISSLAKALILRSGTTAVSVHLGMTGQFRIGNIPKRHREHNLMTLSWGKSNCSFLDFRRFSRVRAALPSSPGALGGFDPNRGLFLRSKRNLAQDLSALKGIRSSPRITWLLRHGSTTGVGNYLANEALGRLNLSPFDACRDEEEAFRILRMCQQLAQRSFRAGGTSFGIGYFRLDGSEGRFSRQLAFYKNCNIPRTTFRNRSVFSRFAV
ncbi:MAG: hypothetical protein HY921_04015 [Elusimicrobia bacterium]|nr:hypothetical protein [Elusimicrobiota bacterium]